MNTNKFRNPDMTYRPAPFWGWNDKLTPDELRRQIREMVRKGWGGFFIHSRVGLITDYLSDEWMECVRICINEAGLTGSKVWLYDEDKWPSGYAGGIVPKLKDAYRSCALVLIRKTELCERDKVFKEVRWNNADFCICARVSDMGDAWFNGACYVDLMNPEAVNAFIESTHEKYKTAVGGYFGKEVLGVFTDEPCYLMEGRFSMPAVPWSEFLPGYFMDKKGYDVCEHVEELFFDTGDYQKVRFDFYDCATRLFKESFTKTYYEWCDKNNLKMTGHFMAEDMMAYQTQWIGAAMPHYELMHWPGIDKLRRRIDEIASVKQLTSVTDQLGKERALSEVFGAMGQDTSFLERKWVTDWEAALGINFVNPHISLYSMRGERKRDFPPNLFYQQPWWEDERGFADYTSRLNYAVSQGKRKTDILVIHPISSVWSIYTPLYKLEGNDPNENCYDKAFEQLSKALASHQLDFHYGDEILMEKHAHVENGRIVIGNMSYSSVIVPPCLTLRTTTIKLLEEFSLQAGKERLIFIRELPGRVDGSIADTPPVGSFTHALTVTQAVGLAERLYPSRVHVIDTIAEGIALSILTHVRIDDGKLVIFMCNSDKHREVRAKIYIPGSGPLCIMDLFTGDEYELPFKQEEDFRVADINFHPAGSLLLTEGGLSRSAPEHMYTGVSIVPEPTPVYTIKNFHVEMLEENVLPLEYVTLWLSGECTARDMHVSQIWHDHFYPAAEGTPFTAEYEFYSDTELNDCFAVVELAENLEHITFNSKRVRPLKSFGETAVFNENNWKDVNFSRIPLNIVKGRNVLVLKGIKHNNITGPGFHTAVSDFKNFNATEAETVYIIGKFKVLNNNNEKFTLTKEGNDTCSMDLSKSGYPFYAGSARYTAHFDCDSSLPRWLKLNDVEASSVRVMLNGKYLSTNYWRPYLTDVSAIVKKGRNILEMELCSTLFNLMGPNWISGILQDLGVGPQTFIARGRMTSNLVFKPFGIGSAVLCD